MNRHFRIVIIWGTLFLGIFRAVGAGLPVVDAPAILQAVKQYLLIKQQYDAAVEELARLGDPKLIKTPAAAALIESLGLKGAGETIDEIQTAATGAAGVLFDANGIFRAPGETFQTAGGQIVARSLERYRKYDAVMQAGANVKEVMHDTQERRESVRQQIQSTQKDLQAAATIAEVQKLQAVLAGLNSELTAIEMDRTAALGRVMVQNIYNQTDAVRQKQAHREETAASVRQATDTLGEVLKVDTSTVRIPNPLER